MSWSSPSVSREDEPPNRRGRSKPISSHAQPAAYARALRGSNVAIFTQDSSLRYETISGSMFGKPPQDVLGRDDDAVLPANSRATIIALKREVLASGEPRNAEVCVGEGPELRWYDLHLEPLRGEAPGEEVTGIGGVAIEITERKEGEAHLRLLMRELTHRSKNLLAVIQAMARQTAREIARACRLARPAGAGELARRSAAGADRVTVDALYGGSGCGRRVGWPGGEPRAGGGAKPWPGAPRISGKCS